MNFSVVVVDGVIESALSFGKLYNDVFYGFFCTTNNVKCDANESVFIQHVTVWLLLMNILKLRKGIILKLELRTSTSQHAIYLTFVSCIYAPLF